MIIEMKVAIILVPFWCFIRPNAFLIQENQNLCLW